MKELANSHLKTHVSRLQLICTVLVPVVMLRHSEPTDEYRNKHKHTKQFD
jgi:hypothetical protein